MFLGLAGYYRWFCKDYAKIISPLHKLIKVNTVFDWTGEYQQAFEKVKEMLSSAPVLAYPIYSQSFLLFTDASGIAVGFVLFQEQEGTERVIAYGGRALRKHEKNYAITELEVLAVIYAVTQCDCYIRCVSCPIITDHVTLQGLLKNPEIKGKVGKVDYGFAALSTNYSLQARQET